MQKENELDHEREHRREEARLRRRRAAAVQQLREQQKARAAASTHMLHARWRHAAVPSYKEMQQQIAKEDAAKQARILKHDGLGGHGGAREGAAMKGDARYQRTAVKGGVGQRGQHTFAYKHPFAADKLGMQNLVMAEFSQDENKMQATTDAIFGNKSDKSKWSHGGLLLSDVNQAPPRTLHQAMQDRRARLRAQAKQQELSAEAQMRRHEAKHARHDEQRLLNEHRRHQVAKPHLRCTIEMLEHGECSAKPHVGTHGDIPQPSPAAAAAAAAKRAADAGSAHAGARGRNVGENDRAQHQSKPAVKAAHEHPQTVVTVPTAGTVISGWAKDVGTWF